MTVQSIEAVPFDAAGTLRLVPARDVFAPSLASVGMEGGGWPPDLIQCATALSAVGRWMSVDAEPLARTRLKVSTASKETARVPTARAAHAACCVQLYHMCRQSFLSSHEWRPLDTARAISSV